MKKNTRYTSFFCVIFLWFSQNIAHDVPKIIGLVAVRNESYIITQYLRALIPYVDAIVMLDDASEDDTVQRIEEFSKRAEIRVEILRKSVWHRDEPGDKNRLLSAGRNLGGTHFIFIDADEMITANCMQGNYLRQNIFALKPGDRLWMRWINLWRSPFNYRDDSSVWSNAYGDFIFCDDGFSSYSSDFIHTSRSPNGLKGNNYYFDSNCGILHFQFVNWNNLLIKQAWYRCLERIRLPQKPSSEINERYAPSKNEAAIILKKVPWCWLDGYDFFSSDVFEKNEQWRKKQVLGWFEQYGRSHFSDLDIWDIDWDN